MFFDPFYRHYCGVQWFDIDDFSAANYIAVTHGHEEHFIDVPEVARRTGAKVLGPLKVTSFLHRKNGLQPEQLAAIDAGESADLPELVVQAFSWKHRDVNLFRSIPAALLRGEFSRLTWAWNGMTKSPFLAPYTGYRLILKDGTTILNYNEGFNTKMTDEEITALGQSARTDVLLGGMQLDFTADVARGVAALNPKLVLLYPPHDRLHALWGVPSSPWAAFAEAAQQAAPDATVIVLEPGHEVDLKTYAVRDF